MLIFFPYTRSRMTEKRERGREEGIIVHCRKRADFIILKAFELSGF